MSSASVMAMTRWMDDPLAFVREGVNDEPDLWQANALGEIGAAVRAGKSLRMALQACKGPGKSRLMAWVIWWFLFTRKMANIVAISITIDNLKANLWKELSLIHVQSPMLEKSFTIDTEKIAHRKHSRHWWCYARGYSSDPDPTAQKSTIAGLHGQHVMVAIDEGGDIPPGLLIAAEGIFLNDVEALLIIGGNATSQDGALYEAAVRRAHRYTVIRVTGDPLDPNRSPRISLTESQALIDDYGRENPYVMVNVLGQFPAVAANKLLGQADVDASVRRILPARLWEQEPIVVGFDIARHGDDSSVLTKRQGMQAFRPKVWRTPDLMVLADQAAGELERLKPDAVFVGVTGLGWGLFDRLTKLGWEQVCIAVDESSEPVTDSKFLNRRAEMWWIGSQWVKRQGAIYQDPELAADLLAPGYEYRAVGRHTKVLIEPNDKLKQALGRSPDKGTSLMLTHAAPVAPKGLHQARHAHQKAKTDFDPYAALDGR